MKARAPVLIAGFGYLGEALAKALTDRGDTVIGLTKSDPTGLDRQPNPVHSCDLSDAEEVAGLANKIPTPRAIIHCASSNRGGPDAYRAVFVDGARNLASAFPGIPLLLTSSTSVYGQTDGSTVTEESPAEPERETGRLLREAEEIVRENGGTVFRLAGIYGPGRSVHLKRFLEGTATIESGEVSRLLNQIHRDDAVAAIVHWIDLDRESTRGQIFNLSDRRPMSQRACYEQLAAHFEKPVPPEAPPNLNRKRAWTHKAVSSEKLQATGWSPLFGDFLDAVRNDPSLVPSIREQLD